MVLGDVYKLDVRTLSINFDIFIYIVKEITHINIFTRRSSDLALSIDYEIKKPIVIIIFVFTIRL
jgi:hypothetical protein